MCSHRLILSRNLVSDKCGGIQNFIVLLTAYDLWVTPLIPFKAMLRLKHLLILQPLNSSGQR